MVDLGTELDVEDLLNFLNPRTLVVHDRNFGGTTSGDFSYCDGYKLERFGQGSLEWQTLIL